MRILLASIHPRALSGQIEGLVGLSKELNRLGHQVEIVSAFGKELLLEDRLALAEHDGVFLGGKLTRIGGILASLAKRARRADLVHLNLPTPAFAVLGDILQVLVPVPVVVGFEAHLAETGRLFRSRCLRDSPMFYLPRLLVNNGLVARCTWHRCARHYVVSSRYQADELRRLGFPPARIRVIPNVIDPDKLQRLNRGDARRQLGLPEGRLVAYIGHYHHVKGVEVLVESFGHLAQRRDDCHLVLAWSGIGDPRPIDRTIANCGVGDRVLCLGRAPVGAIFSAADVLALPYRLTMGQNAYPGLVLEALRVGVPMVTSDLPMLRELLQHRHTALLVPPGDALLIAKAVGELLENKTLASEMVTEQRRLMSGLLNPRRLTKQYVDVYREACTQGAGVEQLPAPADGSV